MSFAGLQKRLQKKARSAETPIPAVKITGTPSVSLSNGNLGTSTNSIYDISLQEVRANHPDCKRQRSPTYEAPPVSNSTPVEGELPIKGTPLNSSLRETQSKKLSEAEFMARRQLADEVVSRCLEHMSKIISVTSLPKNTSDDNHKLDAQSVSGLPIPLCDFLERRLKKTSSATTVSIVSSEDEEYDLFSSLKSGMDNCHDNSEVMFREIEPLVSILRTFWIALCWHWQAALRGTGVKTSREGGWSYNVYLLSRHALPDVVRHTRGREVALALEAWREAYRVRQNVLDFLAYAFHDLEELLQFRSNNKNNKSDEVSRIIPVEFVESLFQMVQHLRRREFSSCRQLYVDLTMGTANWKLGLFSGGEVHMRRSMERIERRRIEHILHNERAVQLLHALRELMDFIQQNEASLSPKSLFYNEKRKDPMDNSDAK
ncbi:Prp18 [Trypanosoma melophagium]|uniref:Prp18 n=1 Tax=Trypanosoma melophagium TaxID=715481 RepID=UPI00351A6F55|nr:Prp18 [Trypanosoma melophagium]